MTARLPPLVSGYPVQPMSRELTSDFVRLCAAEWADGALALPQLKEELGPHACGIAQIAILLQRIGWAHEQQPGLRFTPEVIIFVANMCDRPGELVIWAYTLVEMARAEPCSIARLSEIFPFGFPTDEAVTRYWDAQKLRDGRNQLDLSRTWAPPELSA